MDWIFGMGMGAFKGLKHCFVSYDIACQWFINLRCHQANDWPSHMRLSLTLDLIPMIPVFHYPAHQTKGHNEYNPRLVVGNGTSDNEGIERIWGSHNALGPSTKAMGPETRQLVLDDNFNSWNWFKYIGMGMF